MRMRTLLVSLAATVLVTSIDLAVAQSPTESGQTYLWNFENTEIATVAETVAAATGKKILFHPRVQVHDLVTLVSEHPLSASQMYTAFALAMVERGYVVEESADSVKVYPGKAGRPQG